MISTSEKKGFLASAAEANGYAENASLCFFFLS